LRRRIHRYRICDLIQQGFILQRSRIVPFSFHGCEDWLWCIGDPLIVREDSEHGTLPTTETERWLLLPYRMRVDEMMSALAREAQTLGVNLELLALGSFSQPVQLHCVPDNFSIPESKKFAAYIFDDEIGTGPSGVLGKLRIVAAFGSITDLQVRRHLGNFEAAEVYSDSWGLYASVPGSGIQCV